MEEDSVADITGVVDTVEVVLGENSPPVAPCEALNENVVDTVAVMVEELEGR